jgi:hypothetical protein
MPIRYFQKLDLSDAELHSLREEDFADILRKSGTHILIHHDRYWKEIYPGFYEPLHWMARLSADQATRPSPLSWGFRASLEPDSLSAANGAMPIILLQDLESYNLESLASKRRSHIRKCQRMVKLVQLTGDPAKQLLKQQGYEIFASAMKRFKNKHFLSREQYLEKINDYIDSGHYFVMGGILGDELIGYLSAIVIEGTAYMDERLVKTEALKTDIGSTLTFEFVQVCKRSGKIKEIVSGQHSPEKQSLTDFKLSMGFNIQFIPVRVEINPVIDQFIRWRYPNKYYRLKGPTSLETGNPTNEIQKTKDETKKHKLKIESLIG